MTPAKDMLAKLERSEPRIREGFAGAVHLVDGLLAMTRSAVVGLAQSDAIVAALAKRIAELERELAAARGQRPN